MRKTNILIIAAMAAMICLPVQSKTRKALYVIMDGVSREFLHQTRPATIFDIASTGSYADAYAGGEVGALSQSPTISAIGYTNILTGTWMNKHNVQGNSNIKTNYNYWSLFRIAKAQQRDVKTALFSSWADNRTLLIGEGRPETNNVRVDYAYDGYDLDTLHFPRKPRELQIYDIDSVVIGNAAKCVREKAPDLSWVYLWYTDDAFHITGYSTFSEDYLKREDRMLRQIWDAIKYREKNFDEEWLLIVTTDHGREEHGFNHGGQSAGERGVWMVSNRRDMNAEWGSNSLSQVDINPSICRYLGFTVPRDVEWEQDGIPFFGNADICNLTTTGFDNKVILKWQTLTSTTDNAEVYVSTTNNYRDGGKDTWQRVGTTKASNCTYTVDLGALPKSKLYKFVVVTPSNHITRWFTLK